MFCGLFFSVVDGALGWRIGVGIGIGGGDRGGNVS